MGNKHALVYTDGIIGSTVSVVHAISHSYATGQEVRRVITEDCTSAVSGSMVLVDDYSVGGQSVPHTVYSLFPVFSGQFSPQGEIVVGGSGGGNEVVLRASVESKLQISAVAISINGQLVPSGDIAAVSSAVHPNTTDIEYRPVNLLSVGDYTIEVRVKNELGLEETASFRFIVE